MTTYRMAIMLAFTIAGVSASAQGAPGINVPPAVEAQVEMMQCNICHEWTTKKVGPSWQDVADRYRGRTTYDYKELDGKGAVEKLPLLEGLVKKISKGGKGEWNKYFPMIANDPNGAHVKEITNIARFILSLPPEK